jgi:hypothetical protein
MARGHWISRLVAGGVGAAATMAAMLAGVSADPFSPPQSKATLTITYTLTGSGVDRPESHERDVTWTIKNSFAVKANLTARAPSGFAGLHKPDAAETQREAQRQQAAQAAAADMQGMMAQAQAIAEKCGDDEACMQAEAIKMSQGIDPNSAQLKDAKANIEKASVVPGNRYQMFDSGVQTGSYRIDEKAHQAYFDAACSLRNESPCAYDTTVTGSGALSDGAGHDSYPGGGFAELDAQGGTLIVNLPALGVAKIEKTVQSQNPEIKTGTTADVRIMMDDVYQQRVTVSCGECRSAHGTVTQTIEDSLLGNKAKLTIDWKFTRQ